MTESTLIDYGVWFVSFIFFLTVFCCIILIAERTGKAAKAAEKTLEIMESIALSLKEAKNEKGNTDNHIGRNVNNDNVVRRG